MRALFSRDPVEHRGEELGLVLAADEGGGRTRQRGARDRNADRLPGQDRLGFALQVERLELRVLDRSAGEALGRLADGDRSGLGRGLKAGRDVHGVADHGVAVAHLAGEHLARVDADPEGEIDAGDLLVDLVHGALHGKAGADGALGVVLVGDRRAEDRHDVVADELVDGPAEAGHLLAKPLEGTVHHRLEGLGVHPLGDGGVTRQVGENDGGLATLLGPDFRYGGGCGCRGGGARLAGQPRAALDAELGACGILGSAARTAGWKRVAAGHAKARPLRVLRATRCALHPHVTEVTYLAPRVKVRSITLGALDRARHHASCQAPRFVPAPRSVDRDVLDLRAAIGWL